MFLNSNIKIQRIKISENYNFYRRKVKRNNSKNFQIASKNISQIYFKYNIVLY